MDDSISLPKVRLFQSVLLSLRSQTPLRQRLNVSPRIVVSFVIMPTQAAWSTVGDTSPVVSSLLRARSTYSGRCSAGSCLSLFSRRPMIRGIRYAGRTNDESDIARLTQPEAALNGRTVCIGGSLRPSECCSFALHFPCLAIQAECSAGVNRLDSSLRPRVEHGIDRLSHGGRCVL